MTRALWTLLWAQAPCFLSTAVATSEEAACAVGGECEEDDSALLQLKKKADTDIPYRTLSAGARGMPTQQEMAAARSALNRQPPEELREPEVLKPPYKLKLQPTYLPTPWIGGGFWTRAYGSIPGPTIRIKPGEVLKIEFENALGPGPGYKSCDVSKAELGYSQNPSLICALNTSSLHTHGLHVDGNGKGDNVLRHALPGETIEYTIPVPQNHMGGTHWYHPHVHHATASQAGGGAHGALVVEDPEGYLPKQVMDMPEKMLFLSLVNVAKCVRLESWGLSKMGGDKSRRQDLWVNDAYPDWRWDEVTGEGLEHGPEMIPPQLVVNGQYHPKMTVKEDKWYRLRMTYASIEQRVELWLQGGDATCEFQLLAKDGVYLHTAPRVTEVIKLTSGSRADVAVQCSCPWYAGSHCKANVMFRALWQPLGGGGMVTTLADTKDLLMTIVVEHNGGKYEVVAPEIRPFSVRRPCYLADLRSAEIHSSNRHTLDLPMRYPLVVAFDGDGEVWAHETPPATGNLPVGEIQEWRMTGMQFHPFHIHVNGFQITRINGDDWYMPGDWHDTFLPTGTNEATVRMNVDKFTGKMIAHCHILEHEDNGMMAWFNIYGTEGKTYSKNKQLDPLCYEGVYPGPPTDKELQEADLQRYGSQGPGYSYWRR